MSAQAWLYIFIFLIIFNFTFSSILDYINDKNWNDEIPESLKDYYDKNRYKKAKEYKKARGKMSLIFSLMSIIITLVILISGFYGVVSDYIFERYSSSFLHSGVFFLFFYLINLH